MAHHYSRTLYTPAASVLRTGSWSAADSALQFFFYGRERSAHQSFVAHINLRSSGRICPAEKQTMKLQARAACASAVHIISADPLLNGSNTCGIPRIPNLKICTPLIPRVL